MSQSDPAARTICHISADYPDSHDPARTPVIRALVELVADRFDQRVISLTRTAPRGAQWLRLPEVAWHGEAPKHVSLTYAAPGRGLLHRTLLERLGEKIADTLARGSRPALLVGHKLTIEGIAVARAATLLGVPYALSIQGNTDTRILAMRPDLHPLLRRVWQGAAVVFPFAPWAERAVTATLGARQGPVVPLPCPTVLDSAIAPRVGGEGIVSVFHLHNWRGKNLARLAEAARASHVPLEVIGGGSGDDLADARRAAGAGVAFDGAMDHAALPTRFNRAVGMAMPSRRESFGLVFVEALFAGCPVIYPRGRAVDGWLDGLAAAIAVDPDDTREIAGALLRLTREEARLKAALAEWQTGPAAARLRRDAIARSFGDGLADAIARGAAS